jgi:chromosome segregation ATPase
VALVGSALGYLLEDAAHANHAYDRARASLSTTRHHTTVVSRELAESRTDLALLTRQVGNDTTALSQDTSALQGARAALSSAESQVSQQATLLTSLNTCLGGVEQALNALSVGSQPSAVAALDSVSQSCSAAVAASG